MAINVPMPDLPGKSFLQGLDTGSTLINRLMQSKLEAQRLKQQETQFAQNYALQQQAQERAQALLPYMIQQYQDTHRTAASEADFKDMYRNMLRDALNGSDQSGATSGMPPMAAPNMGVPPGMPPQAQGQPMGAAPMMGQPNAAPALPPTLPPGMQPPVAPTSNQVMNGQEHELRPGNPRLARLDSVAGLVPGVPKPTTHINGGMVFTTYPSGRMTVQKVQGAQTPGERNVSAKEASKIRDQASALINSAHLVQQGYELLDKNPDLTGIGSGLAEKFNLSNNPELGKFTTVTGKLQAELGKYASSRGGIQAVKWASSVKPNTWKPEQYNYGMFEGIQRNLKDDYDTLNAQYKAATGEDLPIPLPKMTRKPKSGSSETSTEGKKVKKVWKLVNGELV